MSLRIVSLRRTRLGSTVSRVALSLVLCAGAGIALAEAPPQTQVQVQDGIAVRPMWRYRELVSAEKIEGQAREQYAALLAKAQQEGALRPANDPNTQRLR